MTVMMMTMIMTVSSINIFRATGTRLDPAVCALVGRGGVIIGQVGLGHSTSSGYIV